MDVKDVDKVTFKKVYNFLFTQPAEGLWAGRAGAGAEAVTSILTSCTRVKDLIRSFLCSGMVYALVGMADREEGGRPVPPRRDRRTGEPTARAFSLYLQSYSCPGYSNNVVEP